MRTKISILILVVFVVGAIAIILRPARGVSTDNAVNLTDVIVATTTYAMSEVVKHSVQTDCWSVVNGGVYNLTSWIDKHPGGSEAILSICGKDGSAAFNDQHGGERRPANELKGFGIGLLEK